MQRLGLLPPAGSRKLRVNRRAPAYELRYSRSARSSTGVVEANSETRPLVNADLEEKILITALGINARHRLAHPQRGRKSSVRRGKGRHHGIADHLDDRACFGRHNLVQYAEVLAHEIVSDQIAYAFIKCRRAFEIGKQKSEACNLKSSIGIECVGVIERSRNV